MGLLNQIDDSARVSNGGHACYSETSTKRTPN